MITKPSQQSNPFSTGGGGVNFETKIQASFAAFMLTGGFVVPVLPRWPIQLIKLQGRYDQHETDDCIVFAQNPQNSQQVSKLLVQIKHVAHVTKQDFTFEEVIHAAWRDFCNPKFRIEDFVCSTQSNAEKESNRYSYPRTRQNLSIAF